MAYQHYQGPGAVPAAPNRDFLWQVFQRLNNFVVGQIQGENFD
jgi:hypothetical protein